MEYGLNLGGWEEVLQNVCDRVFMKVRNLVHKVSKVFCYFCQMNKC